MARPRPLSQEERPSAQAVQIAASSSSCSELGHSSLLRALISAANAYPEQPSPTTTTFPQKLSPREAEKQRKSHAMVDWDHRLEQARCRVKPVVLMKDKSITPFQLSLPLYRPCGRWASHAGQPIEDVRVLATLFCTSSPLCSVHLIEFIYSRCELRLRHQGGYSRR